MAKFRPENQDFFFRGGGGGGGGGHYSSRVQNSDTIKRTMSQDWSQHQHCPVDNCVLYFAALQELIHVAFR